MLHMISFTGPGRAQVNIQKRRLELLSGFGEDAPCLTTANLCRILNDYLVYLQNELSGKSAPVNVGQVQEMLLEVAAVVRSGMAKGRKREFGHFLNGLVGIYREGFIQGGKDAFSLTAADYADVVESISKEYPSYDYDEAVRQLLHYMHNLFDQRKSSWVTVYEHILSMPDTVEAVQLLKEECFLEVQEWVEGGVENLFQILKDFNQMIQELQDKETEIERQIELQYDRISASRGAERGKVIDLRQGRRKREISDLQNKKHSLILERMGKESLITLIEDNIEEFKSILAKARRAFFIRVVQEPNVNPFRSEQSTLLLPCRMPE